MSSLPPGLSPAPRSLHAALAQAPSGRFRGLIQEVDTEFWDRGRGWRSARRWKRKAWMYLGASTPRWRIGCAVVDAGYLATAFVYLYDRVNRVMSEEKLALPWGMRRDFAPSLRADWRLGWGRRRWHIAPYAGGWRLMYQGGEETIELQVEAVDEGVAVVAPGEPFHHTWKLCAQPARLIVHRRAGTDQQEGLGMIDFSLGYPGRETHWNWANMQGQTADGRRLAINLVSDFNAGLENALWLDGQLQPLGAARFQLDAGNPMAAWSVATADGALSLQLQPEAMREEYIALGLLSSHFVQPFGQFTGRLRLDGQDVACHGDGVVEEHRARW